MLGSAESYCYFECGQVGVGLSLPASFASHTSPRASSGRRKMWKGRSMPGRCARLPNRKRVVVRVCALAAQDAHPKQEAVEALEEEVGAESHTDSSSRCDHHGAVMMPPM